MRVPESMSECDERISEDRYGYFTVLFSNSNGLEKEDICDIFAEFGQYLSIRQAGNKNGIHFVTYETYEEAKRAVDGLENHPDVQLKVYRKKRRNHFNGGYGNNNNNCNRWSNGGYANDARQRMNRWTNRQYNEPNYAREECLENENNRELYRESSIWHETSACEDSDDATKKFVNGASDNCETSEFTEDEKSSAYTWLSVQNYLASCNNNNNNDNNTQESESVQTIAATINTEGEQFVKCQEEGVQSIKITEDDKASISSAIVQEEKEEDSTSIIQEIVYAKASEVIIGNVDLRLNEAYLLHLFNKYEPIAISQLVPLRRGKVRYCYVYFKNEDIALKVERSFDKLCLYGRQLVVQRPRRLIAAYLDQL